MPKIENKHRKTAEKWLLLALTIFCQIQRPILSQCLVDKCNTCPSNTTLRCTTCSTGWYKVTYSGIFAGDKTTDACWAIWKLVVGILLALCCCYACCAACFSCYRLGLLDKSQPYKELPEAQKVEPAPIEARDASPVRVIQPTPATRVVQPQAQPVTVIQAQPQPQQIVYQQAQPQPQQVILRPANIQPSVVQRGPVRVINAAPSPRGRVISPINASPERRIFTSSYAG